MKYGKKIETYASSRHHGQMSDPRRMKNPRYAEEYDFTTRIPRAKGYDCNMCGAGWTHMRRFFEARIGQQWHKVLTEFHKKTSVWWMPVDALGRGYTSPMIYTNAYIQGGVVCAFSPYYGTQPLDFSRGALFVHPRTGQLCGAKTHARKQKRALRKDWQSAPIQS